METPFSAATPPEGFDFTGVCRKHNEEQLPYLEEDTRLSRNEGARGDEGSRSDEDNEGYCHRLQVRQDIIIIQVRQDIIIIIIQGIIIIIQGIIQGIIIQGIEGGGCPEDRKASRGWSIEACRCCQKESRAEEREGHLYRHRFLC